MAPKSLNRAHAFFERFPHRSLSSNLFKRQSEGLAYDFGRDHHNPVNVAKENVARPDGHATDFNRDSKIMDLVAGCGILAIDPKQNVGK